MPAEVVDSILTKGIKYFIFLFSIFVNEAKHGVQLRHSRRNVSRVRHKVGNGKFLIGNGVSEH